MIEVNHEYYVSLEVAKLLKEAGFNWGCRGYYDKQILRFNFVWDHNEKGASTQCSAPTLDIAQRWLIEKYRILIEVQGRSLYELKYEYIFTQPCYNATLWDAHSDELEYDTYEEALEAGIKKALELILENKNKN